MNELELEKNKNNKISKKKSEKILESTIHSIVLFYGISFSLFIFYSAYFENRLSFLLTLAILSISSFVTYYNFYGRKIVITKNKFYIYRLNKKSISLSFSKDFLHIKYEKTKLGKLLNYGSILLVTQDSKYYKIHFVNNPEEIFYESIKQYENVMVLINPEYEKKLNNDNNKSGNSERKKNIFSENNFEKIEY